MDIQKIILETAEKYVGQKEIPNNMGFEDDRLQELMEIVGWEEGYAWCALFTELVWKEAYSKADSTIINDLTKLFSTSTVQTFINFNKDENWDVDFNAKEGDIVIWQNFKNDKPLWTGHAGIVVKVNEKTIKTIEGNTNSSGSRDGEGIYLKTRKLSGSKTFRIKGFIHPKQI